MDWVFWMAVEALVNPPCVHVAGGRGTGNVNGRVDLLPDKEMAAARPNVGDRCRQLQRQFPLHADIPLMGQRGLEVRVDRIGPDGQEEAPCSLRARAGRRVRLEQRKRGFLAEVGIGEAIRIE